VLSFVSSKIPEPNLDILFPTIFITFFLIILLISLNRHVENLIIQDISKAIYEPAFKEKNTIFNYNDGLTFNEVMSSYLLPRPDRFISNNLTKGEISNFPYKASNITLIEEHEETDSEGHRHTSTTVIFDGRMYIIKTPFYKKEIILRSKKIGNNTSSAITLIISLIIIVIAVQRILPVFSDPSLKKEFLPVFIFFIVLIIVMAILSFPYNRNKKYKKAKLESDQFNKYFDIEAQNQVELRKTFTPAVMEKLINLRDSIGSFHLSIIGNKIFFVFPRSFDIKYNRPIQELIEGAKKAADKEIKTIKSIIETLKLEEERIKKGIIDKNVE